MSTSATISATPHDNLRDREATGTPTKSAARRVLGELTPKAINAPQNNNTTVDQLEALKSRSPLKQVQTLSPARRLDTENMTELQYPGLGRKRPISEVDGAVAREDGMGYTYRAFDERDGSLRQAFRPDVLAKMREETSTPADDPQADDYSSSEEDTPDCGGNVSQDTAVTIGSFSSLINYNPDGASQNRVSPPPEFPEPQQSVVTSKAETLRLRLRMAMYKVRTNQTTVPLAELSLPTPLTAPTSNPPLISELSTSTTSKTSTAMNDSLASLSNTSISSVPSITLSPARSSTAAASTSISTSTIPKLLPAPLLLPTAYSTRFIAADGSFPSSPPTSVSPSQTHIHPPDHSPTRSFVTPVAQRRGLEQLDSPDMEVDVDVDMDVGARANQRFEDGDLTSSVVKGRAASGLLDLLKAGR